MEISFKRRNYESSGKGLCLSEGCWRRRVVGVSPKWLYIRLNHNPITKVMTKPIVGFNSFEIKFDFFVTKCLLQNRCEK